MPAGPPGGPNPAPYPASHSPPPTLTLRAALRMAAASTKSRMLAAHAYSHGCAAPTHGPAPALLAPQHAQHAQHPLQRLSSALTPQQSSDSNASADFPRPLRSALAKPAAHAYAPLRGDERHMLASMLTGNDHCASPADTHPQAFLEDPAPSPSISSQRGSALADVYASAPLAQQPRCPVHNPPSERGSLAPAPVADAFSSYVPHSLRPRSSRSRAAARAAHAEQLRRFREKKHRTLATKTVVRYKGRKRYADSRPRVNGRFVRTGGCPVPQHARMHAPWESAGR